jgi:hypothetical protein
MNFFNISAQSIVNNVYQVGLSAGTGAIAGSIVAGPVGAGIGAACQVANTVMWPIIRDTTDLKISNCSIATFAFCILTHSLVTLKVSSLLGANLTFRAANILSLTSLHIEALANAIMALFNVRGMLLENLVSFF